MNTCHRWRPASPCSRPPTPSDRPASTAPSPTCGWPTPAPDSPSTLPRSALIPSPHRTPLGPSLTWWPSMPAPAPCCLPPIPPRPWPARRPIWSRVSRHTLHHPAPRLQAAPGSRPPQRKAPRASPCIRASRPKTPTPTARPWTCIGRCTRCCCPTPTRHCSTFPAPPAKWCATPRGWNGVSTTWAPGCTGSTCSATRPSTGPS